MACNNDFLETLESDWLLAALAMEIATDGEPIVGGNEV
jgi:hypothetical protein